MLSHAARLATSPSNNPFLTILQSAASRAWCRTSPRRVHRYSANASTAQGHVHAKDVGDLGESSGTSIVDPVYDYIRPCSWVPPVSTFQPPCSAVPGEELHGSKNNSPDACLPTSTSFTYAQQDRSAVSDHSVCQQTCTPQQTLESADVPSSTAPTTAPTCKDDPPWPRNIPPHVSQRESPEAVVPQTSEDLYQHLLQLLRRDPSPHVSLLLRYHALYPSLQTTTTYNLLISLALWHNKWGAARRLLNRMEFLNINPDMETRKLRVRLLIRTGNWIRAWRYETSGTPDGESHLPFPIWAEFFGSSKRRSMRRTETFRFPDGEMATRSVPIPEEEIGDPALRLEQIRRLTRYLPSAHNDELRSIPAYIVRTIVEVTLKCNRADYAKGLTECYFGTLPSAIDKAWLDHCLEIMHLHMIHVQKRGLAKYYGALWVLRRYMPMHPQFRPNAKTLLCILRTLQGTKKAGSIAQRFVKSFKKRWGPSVVDERVHRRLGSLAVKEGRMDIAQAELAKEPSPEQRSRLLSAKADWEGSSHFRARGLPRHRTIYSRRNIERWRWKLLCRRIWRLSKKQLLARQRRVGWQYQARILQAFTEKTRLHAQRTRRLREQC